MKKNELFSDILTSVTKYFKWLVLVIVVLICLSGIRSVKSGEVAIVLRFGKLLGDTPEEQLHEPGLMFALPYIFDEVIIVPTGNVMEQTVTTHYTSGEMTTLHNNGYVITGDRNIAVVSASVKYVVSDPVAYALNIADISKLIDASVSHAMVEEAASISVDSLLTSGKDAYGAAVLSNAQRHLSALGAGITIGTVELTNVGMPSEVRETYNAVNSASVQANTQLEQAKQYRENLIPEAQAKANALISAANASYSERVGAANTDLYEFWGLLDEYSAGPEVVRTRVYNNKLSAALAKIGKIRVVQDGETKIVIS